MPVIIGNALPRTPERFSRSYQEACQQRLTRQDFPDFRMREIPWGPILLGAGVCFALIVIRGLL